jgi:uncharacterized protein (DUF952 family)/ribosomal protein S18 acetylase RimI-like enzyme
VSGDLLLHLIEPADWRRALSTGEVRPPSLESPGFVHLSTPAQVHLPAERLYPGRRDLVLLVVDPARLPDAVRFEPGVPPGPDGMLFPHLYGPLPVTAVVATLPYRPPAPLRLPATDDALGRALAFYTSLVVRRAVGVGDVPGGVAVLDPDYPLSRDNNGLLLTEAVDAATIEAAAEEVGGNAGWPHLSAELMWPDAAGVAADLTRRGWTTEERVVMTRPAAPASGGDRAEVVAQHEAHEFWDRNWRQNLPEVGAQLDRVVAQLVGREHLNDRVVAVSDVVVREDGRVVASGQLRIDGATAAIDSVLTDPAAQGRGYGNAVLAHALTLAADAGCDLVVLQAAADDWPRHWYARLGFGVVGTTWSASRPA